MKTGIALCRSVLLLAVALALSCGRAPRVQPGPAAEPTLPAVSPGFLMKSFQVSMSEEMRKSYGQADEIMIGIFAGICWDFYEGNRSVYLVEGQKNLVFLEVGLDDVNSESYRKFIDAYPVTRECRAVDVFNLTIRRLVEGEKD